MGWVTIYITGREEFHDEVLRRLESSELDFMPGYAGVSADLGIHDMYWIDEKTDLKELKKAIGSKLIWKYRLSFFTSLESFIESQNTSKSSTPERDILLPLQEA